MRNKILPVLTTWQDECFSCYGLAGATLPGHGEGQRLRTARRRRLTSSMTDFDSAVPTGLVSQDAKARRVREDLRRIAAILALAADICVSVLSDQPCHNAANEESARRSR
jgi:hypothetical protein